MFGDDLQRAPGQVALLFQRLVRVVHRAGADGPPDALAGQGVLQQFHRVHLDQHVLEILDPVAIAARVAVDALVLAASIEVHVVLQPEPGIGLLDVVEEGLGVNFFNHRSSQPGTRANTVRLCFCRNCSTFVLVCEDAYVPTHRIHLPSKFNFCRCLNLLLTNECSKNEVSKATLKR